MKKNRKKVYAALAADILHKGHINVLKKASKLGDVTVGLLTDSAIKSYKDFPFFSYKQRKIIIKNIKFVKKVIPQTTLDYSENLQRLKPNYVIHGDDWKTGIQNLKIFPNGPELITIDLQNLESELHLGNLLVQLWNASLDL